ncbi:MAG: prepilin peptidase [Lacrimispora sp.]|uniref:prepilin peptidase n=1 Tax=Lacrimispora sp. TaxID=2719234 RepID=UPI0039E4FE09
MLFILGAGAYFDVREHRIPNWLVLSGFISGILLDLLKSAEILKGAVFWQILFLFCFKFAAAAAVFFPLFLCRMIGAGDIKVIGLIFAYLGPMAGAAALLPGLLIGAVWSFVKMASKGILFKRLSYFVDYVKRVRQTGKFTAYYSSSRDGYEVVIPLGLCMFLGMVVYIIILY